MMDEDKLRKIVEVLLNDNGRTPEEAEAARRQAAKLLAKHGVDMDELLRSGKSEMEKNETTLTRHDWIVAKYVGGRIAALTGTKRWFADLPSKTGRRSDRKTYSFAGLRPDVEWATWLFQHILSEGRRGASGSKTDRTRSDFLAAFASTVARRIDELVTATEEAREEVGYTDLVPVKDAAIDDYLKSLGLNLGSSRTRGRGIADRDAASRGREAGERVGLGRPVGGPSGVLALPSK